MGVRLLFIDFASLKIGKVDRLTSDMTGPIWLTLFPHCLCSFKRMRRAWSQIHYTQSIFMCKFSLHFMTPKLEAWTKNVPKECYTFNKVYQTCNIQHSWLWMGTEKTHGWLGFAAEPCFLPDHLLTLQYVLCLYLLFRSAFSHCIKRSSHISFTCSEHTQTQISS